ncbi:melatonin receptor type 1B-B isoform X1 [Synchiropus splendidus]|uniref:melatonin receptor type 1B-B isoform X1 n=1 Tax=Synchiropus splendidus TaxID=270530 RepID=UPI00237DD527|nr:melatonin receptor type 1B-B isoform X1 [Synchiropus splendidus]
MVRVKNAQKPLLCKWRRVPQVRGHTAEKSPARATRTSDVAPRLRHDEASRRRRRRTCTSLCTSACHDYPVLSVCVCVCAGNVFVVSLAFADLVVAFYPYPLVLYALFHDGWALGDTQCMVSGFLMGLSVIGSIFNITGIAVNRYCYICHSFSYSRLYSYRNTLLFVALIWLLTLVAIVPNFFVGSLRYDPRVYSCTFAQNVSSSYTVAVVVVHFLVPIGVVTFCYLRIWILVIQVRRKVKTEESPRLRPSDLRNFITMFVVFVLFAICWAPLNLIGLAVAIDPARVVPRIPEWLFVVSYFMAYFNSCLNAIIYGLLNRNFRNEYKRIVTSVWVTRLFVTETSRAATDGRSLRSKQSPQLPLNNNDSLRERANKD